MAIEHSGDPRTTRPPIAPDAIAPPTVDGRREVLEQIAAEVRVCTRCRLWETRTNAVPGEGHPDTEVVFVGEGPGQNEDIQGRPFVGAAGSFLTELVRSVGWQREEVFITNVVKCRPPGNRDPEPDEMAACAPYLKRQLAVLDPALVVTLGRFSLQAFMPGARIGGVHGTVQPVDPATGASHAQAYAMYHPAAAFRQQALRETLQLDMTGIPAALQAARLARPGQSTSVEPFDPEPAAPEPAAPEPARPEPAASEPASPEPVTADLTIPEPGPATAGPETPGPLENPVSEPSPERDVTVPALADSDHQMSLFR